MFQRWARPILVLAALAIAVAVPYLVNSFYVDLLSEVLIFGLLAMSIDVLSGYTGLTSLGHAGIFGVSAYVVGYLLAQSVAPFSVAIPAGIIAAILTAALFAIIAIRTSGVFFLMVTLAEGMIVWGIAYRWSSVTGAENGIRGIPRPPMFQAYWQFYYLVLVVFVVLSVMMYRLVNSRFGLTLKGIRESESRMRTLGYNTALHKFIGFTATGFFAGVAGALYALYNGFVSPAAVDFLKSAEEVLMVIVGGVGTLFGGVVGAAIIVFAENIVSLYTERWTTVMGLIFVVTILFAPDGLVGNGRHLMHRLLELRRAHKPVEETSEPLETVPEKQLEFIEAGRKNK